MDCEKGALVFTTFAFHMHSLTIAIYGYAIHHGRHWKSNDDNNNNNGRGKDDDRDDGGHGDYKARDDAIKAFLIIAYLLYLFAFLIQVILKTGEDLKLSKKIMGIILFIVLILAGLTACSLSLCFFLFRSGTFVSVVINVSFAKSFEF